MDGFGIGGGGPAGASGELAGPGAPGGAERRGGVGMYYARSPCGGGEMKMCPFGWDTVGFERPVAATGFGRLARQRAQTLSLSRKLLFPFLLLKAEIGRGNHSEKRRRCGRQAKGDESGFSFLRKGKDDRASAPGCSDRLPEKGSQWTRSFLIPGPTRRETRRADGAARMSCAAGGALPARAGGVSPGTHGLRGSSQTRVTLPMIVALRGSQPRRFISSETAVCMLRNWETSTPICCITSASST